MLRVVGKGASPTCHSMESVRGKMQSGALSRCRGRGCEEPKLTEGVCSGRARLQVLIRTFGTLKMSSHFL